MKLRNIILFLLMSVLFLFTVVPAQAIEYLFDNITNNNAGDALIGESQLRVNVTEGDDIYHALFTFGNDGPEASSICDVYFDDGTLLGIASIINSDPVFPADHGVSFTQDASPGNLPGANDILPNFETTAGFSADSDPPAQPNGVNPGETLGILFNLQSGGTFDNVLDELNDGRLRIGIHVQGFATGGSESFVSYYDEGNGGGGGGGSVPEPATMLLLGSGLIWIAVSSKKKFKKRNG